MWEPKHSFRQLIEMMVDEDMATASGRRPA